jgi:hypothetical protein
MRPVGRHEFGLLKDPVAEPPLERRRLGPPHHVQQEYPEAGHGLVNDHESADDKSPPLFAVVAKLMAGPGCDEAVPDGRPPATHQLLRREPDDVIRPRSWTRLRFEHTTRRSDAVLTEPDIEAPRGDCQE